MIISEMHKTIEKIGPALKDLEWQNDLVYAGWLSQAYYIAKQSTSYLGLAMMHAAKYPAFHKRCTAHIAEETGHEKLIMNDLAQLGYSLFPELPMTSAVYQPQYYRIAVENPLSFIGYVLFLELLAPAYGPYVIDRVSNKKALSFLKVHTTADEDHVEEAAAQLAGLPEEVQRLALANFKMTAASYELMLINLASGELAKQAA